MAIAGSIIFHHFGVWANYTEAEFTDEKYDVTCKNVNAKKEIDSEVVELKDN